MGWNTRPKDRDAGAPGMRKICLVPEVKGVGGMVSFQAKFSQGLMKRGIEICHDPTEKDLDAILIIGGTQHLAPLMQAKRRKIPIVQRLDGMNWVHRIRKTGLRHFIKAETGNWLLSFIRSRIADRIIYQSAFSKQWWERVFGATRVPNEVVYNGVDLNTYTPDGKAAIPQDAFRLLLVEGSLLGGYDIGLLSAIELAMKLRKHFRSSNGKDVELMVVGLVGDNLKEKYNAFAPDLIKWRGLVKRDLIPEIDRSAHLLISGDINAACPNSVIEALACGLPVVGFDTGALPELVCEQAGKIVPYGGNPWRLESPNIDGLVKASLDILDKQEAYRDTARRCAEEKFSLEKMVDGYLEMLGS